ncbi:hypothetical protein AVEN_150100-1 [Araneus ventricosus]|uniref:Uncharacterized protein n=1 Tax=Araneus ventricosus TaxID=182803 RepID=A0A4Y2DE64_ARAVE|nr:hypothetical protein AVEN_150100-1 [Araneus ventricosus]
MEFLEHGKEKAIVSFKNRWKLAQRNGKAGIPTNSKSNTSCTDSNLGPRCEGSDTSKDLPRLEPCDEARKSEIHRVWGEIGDRRAVAAHFGASVNDVPHFST